MKRYRIKKFVDAQPMTQNNAESLLGKKVQNLLYGNSGYLVDDEESGIQWVPMTVFEKHAMRAHSMTDRCNVMISDLMDGKAVLEKYRRYGKPSLKAREKIINIMRRMDGLCLSLKALQKYFDEDV